MSDELLTPAEVASKEAAHAAKNAAQKVELARQLQFQEWAEDIAKKATSTALAEAATVAKKIVNDASQTASKMLSDSSDHVTNIGVIAADISYMKKDIAEIKPKLETIETKLEQSVKEERGISNKSYAPYLAWTILLGLLAVFGLAVAQKLVTLVGI